MSGLVCGLGKSGEWERRSIVVATIVKMKTKGEEEVPREGVVANWRDAQRYGTAACLAQKGTRYELKLVTILAVECRLRKATHMVPSAFARREGARSPTFPSVWILGSWNAGSPGPGRLAASTLWDSKLSNPPPPVGASPSQVGSKRNLHSIHGRRLAAFVRLAPSPTFVGANHPFLLRMS